MNQPPQQPYPQQQPGYAPPPQKQGMGAGKIILIVVGVIALLLFGTCAVCTMVVGGAANAVEEKKKEEQFKVEQQLKDCQGAEVVEWAGIAAALKDNEAKVAAAWKGNCAKVSGVVEGIDSGFDDKPIVKIGTGETLSLNDLRCKPVDDQKALNLSKGQTLTVWGIGGDEIMGSLTLDHCDW